MSDNARPDPGQSAIYQIRLKGHLGSQWSGWFEGLSVTLEENGITLLTGPVVDQAALHGLLRLARDVGLPLVSVNRIEPAQPDAQDTQDTPATPVNKRIGGETHNS